MKKQLLCLTLLLATALTLQAMTWRPQDAGPSWSGNPLKGMLAYDFSDYSFPHSLEWFYLPVSDVQQSLTSYDWTALERKLNAIAGRGHQAVFRFYYDYPGEPTGIPQFVRDNHLTLRPYNEPDALGGSGLCPDYGNEFFVQSMEAFIAAFGDRYDGDGRIGYITIGLLGFWGEWHNWPYDEDTSDGKPDWSVPTSTFRRVLDAFQSAFSVTKICVREPKGGISYSGRHVGFHDDSFAYATLSQASGGQSWSFWQKMKNAGLSQVWQTEAIGGEIYPPLQNVLFAGGSGECQDWNRCVSETHPTWMLCEQIKYYNGQTRQKAIDASVQMGYDLQVTASYFDDITTADPWFPLTIQMRNIGVAPFYYGPDLWPVVVAVRQNGTVVDQTVTPWDLRTVAADEQIVTFDYTWHRQFPQGTYEVCIKVQNPLPNGNVLGFANARQENSGWLPVGSFTVSRPSSVSDVPAAGMEYRFSGNLLQLDAPQEHSVGVYTLSGKCLYQGRTGQLTLESFETVLLVVVDGECLKLEQKH